jgi:hypothetical protein
MDLLREDLLVAWVDENGKKKVRVVHVPGEVISVTVIAPRQRVVPLFSKKEVPSETK